MPSEVRFTRAQRLDLVRISAAAVASTVFFTVPMFLVRPPNAPPPPRIASFAPAQPTTPVDLNAVSVVTSTEVASVTTPSLQTNATGRSRAAKPPQVRARRTSPAAPPSLGRRLVRFFAGKGKYNVKPFPTVSASGS